MRYKVIQGGFFPGEHNACSNLISPSVALNPTTDQGRPRHPMSGCVSPVPHAGRLCVKRARSSTRPGIPCRGLWLIHIFALQYVKELAPLTRACMRRRWHVPLCPALAGLSQPMPTFLAQSAPDARHSRTILLCVNFLAYFLPSPLRQRQACKVPEKQFYYGI